MAAVKLHSICSYNPVIMQPICSQIGCTPKMQRVQSIFAVRLQLYTNCILTAVRSTAVKLQLEIQIDCKIGHAVILPSFCIQIYLQPYCSRLQSNCNQNHAFTANDLICFVCVFSMSRVLKITLEKLYYIIHACKKGRGKGNII